MTPLYYDLFRADIREAWSVLYYPHTLSDTNLYSTQLTYGYEDMFREQVNEYHLFALGRHRIRLFHEGRYVLIAMKYGEYQRLGNDDARINIGAHEMFSFGITDAQTGKGLTLRGIVVEGMSRHLMRTPQLLTESQAIPCHSTWC